MGSLLFESYSFNEHEVVQQHSILFCWSSIYPPPHPHPLILGCQAAASHLQSQISPKMLITYSIFKHVNEELFKHKDKMVDSNLKYDPSDRKLLECLCFICSMKCTNAFFFIFMRCINANVSISFQINIHKQGL